MHQTTSRWKRLIALASILAVCIAFLSTTVPQQPAAAKEGDVSVPITQGEKAHVVTTAQLMALQAAKDAIGKETRKFIPTERDADMELPYDPTGPAVASTGSVPGVSPNSPVIQGGQTLSTNFTAEIWGNNVPPDTQGAVGPTQFIAVNNYSVRTFNKSTGTPDGQIYVTLDTFFSSVSHGLSIFDPIARYDRTIQRWIITAEDAGNPGSNDPNYLYVAVSASPTITSSTLWYEYWIHTALVTPTSATNCFADYPTTAVDANFILMGTNNFCPNTYAASDVYVVIKSTIVNGGAMSLGVFRNVGQFTPRGVDSWDADVSTAPGYIIAVANSSTVTIRRITFNGSSLSITTALNVTVPQIASPIALEHLGNAHPGGTYNGKVDAGDTRFMPAVRRGTSLWAAHGTTANSSGVGTAAGDRVASRWYQFGNIGATPTLTQSGTIYDSAASNPKSYTYPGVAVTGQGHTAFGFSVVAANIFNSAGFTGRLSGHAAGFTNTVQIFASGAGAYNAFDVGQSRAQRWGDYSQSTLDPCDDMTVWTIQEFTGTANTSGFWDAEWGQKVARLNAPPPPPTGVLALSPSSVPKVGSVNVTVNATPTNGEGFYNTPSTGADACRTQISATATNNVFVSSITVNTANQIVLNLNTAGATASSTVLTITNPDNQQTTVTLPITTGSVHADTIGVYKTGTFSLRNTNSAGAADITASFGGDASDLPVAGDWNGDSIDTIGVYRSSTGVYYLSDSNTSPAVNYSIVFGNPGDTPFAGKWINTMTHDGVGVYRNSNGILYQKTQLTTGFSDYFAIYGNPGDQGFAGDWDGNGFDSIGIYRSSNQTWFLSNNSTPGGITFSDINFTWNISTALAVVGDWNADGIATVGFFNSSAVFDLHSANAAAGTDTTFAFGPTGGKPIAGKWVTGPLPPPANSIIVSGNNPDGNNANDNGRTD